VKTKTFLFTIAFLSLIQASCSNNEHSEKNIEAKLTQIIQEARSFAEADITIAFSIRDDFTVDKNDKLMIRDGFLEYQKEVKENNTTAVFLFPINRLKTIVTSKGNQDNKTKVYYRIVFD
jgi:hypothetical protein